MIDPADGAVSFDRPARGPHRRVSVRARAISALRRFWRIAWDANITGQAAMIAYNMLLGIIPIALLGLFVAGQVLSSHSVQQSVFTDLRAVFPGTAEPTLNRLLAEITNSTTSTGGAGPGGKPVARVIVLGRAGHRLCAHL